MIIRRRHTANFTTIGNVLFEDERLEADEVGMLAYLLSRPHDWEVRRPALMRRWRVGPGTVKRMVDNWLRTGWARAEKIRLPNGTFDITYEIRDEPGPGMTDEEIRRALSLVSSEAASDDSEGMPVPDDPSENHHPPPSEPGVADTGVALLLKTDSTKPEREGPIGYDRKAAFIARFEARWPTSATDDRERTASAAREVPDDEEDAALDFIGPFLDELKRHGRTKVPAGSKYLRQMPWRLRKDAQSAEEQRSIYPVDSLEAKALSVLHTIAGKESAYHTIMVGSDGLVRYRGTVDARLLALAQAPKREEWLTADYRAAAAWEDLLSAYLTIKVRNPLKAGAKVPWPFPPSKDGKIYTTSTGPPTIPGTLMTEEDQAVEL